jgi:outer membrane scaffolding protein for murein synthesis (MipA/OmpV family)
LKAAWLAASVLMTACAGAVADTPAEAGPAVGEVSSPTTPSTAPRLRIERPLWELGLGVSGLRLPDYRGADQSHNYLLPLPYIVYRGEWLKSDREGTRLMALNSDRVKIDLSFGAAAPSRSDTAAREGMPELPGNAEIGPSLNVTLGESKQDRWKLDLRMPLRAAISLQRSPKYIGTTFSPNLNLDIAGVAGSWNVGLLTGPLFGNRKYHEHYYSVDAPYATAERPEYSARGGYGGWQALASTSRKFGDAWLGAFVRYEALRGAVYDDSPLVRRHNALTMGFGLSWVLKTSTEMVVAGE